MARLPKLPMTRRASFLSPGDEALIQRLKLEPLMPDGGELYLLHRDLSRGYANYMRFGRRDNDDVSRYALPVLALYLFQKGYRNVAGCYQHRRRRKL